METSLRQDGSTKREGDRVHKHTLFEEKGEKIENAYYLRSTDY